MSDRKRIGGCLAVILRNYRLKKRRFVWAEGRRVRSICLHSTVPFAEQGRSYSSVSAKTVAERKFTPFVRSFAARFVIWRRRGGSPTRSFLRYSELIDHSGLAQSSEVRTVVPAFFSETDRKQFPRQRFGCRGNIVLRSKPAIPPASRFM